jgi:hypothetical protein
VAMGAAKVTATTGTAGMRKRRSREHRQGSMTSEPVGSSRTGPALYAREVSVSSALEIPGEVKSRIAPDPVPVSESSESERARDQLNWL